MRQFYLTYPSEEICYTLCSKLSWSHNRLIMRIQDSDARHYYLQEAAQEGWSVRQLERNIESHYYQRLLATSNGNIPQMAIEAQPQMIDVKSFVKDPYVLEFVGLPPYPNHKENQVEEALTDNMQQFLLELGKGFSFVGRQYRISTETSHYRNEKEKDVLLRYLIELIYGYDNGTLNSLNKKTNKNKKGTHFLCYSLIKTEEISSKINQI